MTVSGSDIVVSTIAHVGGEQLYIFAVRQQQGETVMPHKSIIHPARTVP